MATNSLQPARRRSFNLPSFRRLSVGERQEAARNADEMAQEEVAARVQKAAAWQWYTRGGLGGETVQVPTTRPPVKNSQAPTRDDKLSGVIQKKTVESPLAESPRAASRFKAEASSASFGAPRPTLSAPSGGPNPTPLYDQFELSSLRTQIADYVERLQHQPTKDIEQSPAAAEHRSMPPSSAFSVSSDHQQSKAPPAVNSSDDHQHLTTLPSSAVPVASASTTPLHIRPFSALHRLFRKVVFGSATSTKSRKNLPQTIDSTPPMSDVHGLGILPEEEEDNMVVGELSTQYHYHHYIHHHHHHYHYVESPEEQTNMLIRSSRRRHSESSNGRPPIPSLWEEKSGEEEAEAEKSPMEAYLARRRRHSDSFSGHLQPKKAGFDDKDEGIKRDSASGMQFWRPERRQYNSERFSPNKISTMVSEEIAQSVAGRGQDSGVKCRHCGHEKHEEAFRRGMPGGGF